MARTGTQPLLHRLSGDDMDVFLQPTGYPAVQLLCSVSLGITVLLRDILFAPPLAYYALHLSCLTLSVLLLCTLTFFYARKNWQSYTKRNLWAICIIDMLIAALYNYDIYLEPFSEYTNYMLTEIWIRPTITYGLVACFVTERLNDRG